MPVTAECESEAEHLKNGEPDVAVAHRQAPLNEGHVLHTCKAASTSTTLQPIHPVDVPPELILRARYPVLRPPFCHHAANFELQILRGVLALCFGCLWEGLHTAGVIESRHQQLNESLHLPHAALITAGLFQILHAAVEFDNVVHLLLEEGGRCVKHLATCCALRFVLLDGNRNLLVLLALPPGFQNRLDQGNQGSCSCNPTYGYRGDGIESCLDQGCWLLGLSNQSQGFTRRCDLFVVDVWCKLRRVVSAVGLEGGVESGDNRRCSAEPTKADHG
mmetsp:Transcript_74861/g.173524  ORF Transcript_74861/g.173524 Transcript_74861/m.173524 type:complete len:276 (+) Transcript_74861:858-1685(+)